jgi:hypothetical protein
MKRMPAKSPKPKLHKCRVCHEPFAKSRAIQPTCEKFECKVTHGEKVAAKSAAKRVLEAKRAAAANIKTRKEAIKRRPDLLSEAQTAFNAYIRARDILAGHPCICCGKPFEPQKPGGSIDAGHYLSRGSSCHLRFDERNVHAQRKNCNRPGGTTRAAFRAGMEARIGLEALEALEADQASREWTADDLRAIRALYRDKLKELKARA